MRERIDPRDELLVGRNESLPRELDSSTAQALPFAAAGHRSGIPLMTARGVLQLQRSVGNAATVARLTAGGEEEEESLQAFRGAVETSASPREGVEHDAEAGGGASPIHRTIASAGSPIDSPTRASMERHFGESFADVRLHMDATSTDSVRAAAYTVGNDIVMHPGHVAPGTPAAQRTLAHELTHVVQQRNGPVHGTPAPGGIKISDPGDRFELEAEQRASEFESAALEEGPDEEHEAGPTA